MMISIANSKAVPGPWLVNKLWLISNVTLCAKFLDQCAWRD